MAKLAFFCVSFQQSCGGRLTNEMLPVWFLWFARASCMGADVGARVYHHRDSEGIDVLPDVIAGNLYSSPPTSVVYVHHDDLLPYTPLKESHFSTNALCSGIMPSDKSYNHEHKGRIYITHILAIPAVVCLGHRRHSHRNWDSSDCLWMINPEVILVVASAGEAEVLRRRYFLQGCRRAGCWPSDSRLRAATFGHWKSRLDLVHGRF